MLSKLSAVSALLITTSSAYAMTILHLPSDPHGGPVAAPELSPATAVGALTLLVGTVAVIRSRRRGK
jgi:hypothetical protein